MSEHPGGDHRWAVAVVVHLDAEQAATLAANPSIAIELEAEREARGPLCEDCRVHWRDVHADPAKPWPCPGARPAQLGGVLLGADEPLPRRERRAKQRKAAKAKPPPARQARQTASAALVTAMREANAKRAREKAKVNA